MSIEQGKPGREDISNFWSTVAAGLLKIFGDKVYTWAKMEVPPKPDQIEDLLIQQYPELLHQLRQRFARQAELNFQSASEVKKLLEPILAKLRKDRRVELPIYDPFILDIDRNPRSDEDQIVRALLTLGIWKNISLTLLLSDTKTIAWEYAIFESRSKTFPELLAAMYQLTAHELRQDRGKYADISSSDIIANMSSLLEKLAQMMLYPSVIVEEFADLIRSSLPESNPLADQKSPPTPESLPLPHRYFDSNDGGYLKLSIQEVRLLKQLKDIYAKYFLGAEDLIGELRTALENKIQAEQGGRCLLQASIESITSEDELPKFINFARIIAIHPKSMSDEQFPPKNLLAKLIFLPNLPWEEFISNMNFLFHQQMGEPTEPMIISKVDLKHARIDFINNILQHMPTVEEILAELDKIYLLPNR